MLSTPTFSISLPQTRATPSVRPSVRVHASPPGLAVPHTVALRPPPSANVAASLTHKPADSSYLCVHSRPQRFGTSVAYYSTNDSTLYCGELPNMASAIQLKHRLSPRPAIILTASAIDSPVYCALQTNELQPMRSYTVKSLPLSAFSHEAGLARLQLLRLSEWSDVQQHIDRFRHRMYLRSLINIDNPILCGCLGALLSHLVTLQLSGQTTDTLTIATIRAIPAASIVHCDALTTRTLGIFASEHHPGSASTVKEGVSVYAMLNRTKSGAGGRMLREWLAWPTTDRGVLEGRLNAIEFFMRAENEAAVAAVTASLRQPRLMNKFQTSKPSARDWRSLATCLHHLLNIDEAVSHLSDTLPLIQSFHRTVRSKLSNLLRSITTILDLHADNPTHITIHHDIDSRLDRLKHQRAQLPFLLDELMKEDGDYGGEMEGRDFMYVYLQQMGFLVRLSGEERWEEGDWLFEDGGYDFYKNERTRQLDEEIGDVDSVIKDVEDAFVLELQSRVELQAADITALAQRTYELDCYMALASAARDMHLSRPQLSDETVLHITRGRHLLQENYVDPFIPNDTSIGELGKAGGQVHIITGPNRSGKSVYVQQVGLIAYLALCGSFVPAESAVVGLLDGIYACMSTGHSVTSDMSSFCQESAHMAYAQRHCTARSLCLIDEYGKGTAAVDGLELLTAALQCWAEKAADCPLVLASTHYHEMFSMDLIHTNERVKAYTMTFINETDGSSGKAADNGSLSHTMDVSSPAHAASLIPSIVPLFKLQAGVCADSYALSCCKAAGLPAALLDRAASLMSAFQSSQRVTPWQYVLDERRAENADSDARVWAAFTHLVALGLDKCSDEEVEALRAVLLQQDEAKQLKAEEERQEAHAAQPVHRSASVSLISVAEDGPAGEDQVMQE